MKKVIAILVIASFVFLGAGLVWSQEEPDPKPVAGGLYQFAKSRNTCRLSFTFCMDSQDPQVCSEAHALCIQGATEELQQCVKAVTGPEDFQ